ncbi:hypothetical protein [Glycomyces tenuis]|uniref:hypothetical protein n=1 Tax=Glycomyces tenuis TaxID=58116 RepID=UPI00041117B3|nr:hypothetical protein [Glycomyces tenuis]
MNWRRALRLSAGAVVSALGLLWIAQGAALLEIQPILCVAECEPVTGGSSGWLAAGVVAFLAGLAVLAAPWRRRR